jgi:hypothetical protein
MQPKINKRKKERALMTTKQRKATLFRYRIVITVPPWGVLPVASAVGIALLARPMFVTNVISIVLVILGLILVIKASAIVKALRHDVHEVLHNIGNEDAPADDFPVEDGEEIIRLKRINNSNGNARVSGN